MVFLNNGQLEFVEAITTSFSFDFDFVDIVVIKLSYAILFNETAVQNLPIIRNELVGLQRISDLISHCSLFIKVISGCFCTRQTLLHHKIKSIYEDSFIYRIYIIFMNLTKINKVLILNARFLFISTSSHYLYCLIYFSFQFLQLIFFGQRFFF